MAGQDELGDEPDLTPDELAPSAGQEHETIPVFGILGESPEPHRVRLFLDLEFGTYYDIPRDSIVRREKMPAQGSPLGVDSSLVLVRKGTPLAVHRVTSRPIEEEFLAGDFTAPGTFRSFSELAASGASRPGPRYIPSFTIFGHACCWGPSKGNCFQAVGEDSTWPTSPCHGCTRVPPCIV